MDFDNLNDYNLMIRGGNKYFDYALELIAEQKFLEAKAYFLDASKYYLKAENVAIDNKYQGLISEAKTKKEKAEKEADECEKLNQIYFPIEDELE